ncbi:MAG: serine/threonine-protein kinase [Polyangiaceae bacterium]
MSSPSLIPSSASTILGQMAGEYRLRRKLGEGGFGTVYEAEHPVLKRRAAVKVLHQVAGLDSDAVMRFIAEAQAVNQIQSAHIIDVFSFGRLSDGRHFFVMDLLDGEPLDHYLAREKRIDVESALRLLRPITEALDSAHSAGIVHRDLKPQNVFLTWSSSGETVPKLLDFGMAKLLSESPVRTASGTPMGTPLYMSPEQARGERVDGRSDIYSLGVLCHEMLSGKLPITGQSTIAVLVAQLTQPAPPLSESSDDLPEALDQPILNMLAKEATARPETAGAALAALIEAAKSAGIEAAPGLPKLPRPPARKAVEDESAGLPAYTPLEMDSPSLSGQRGAYSTAQKRELARAVLGSIALLGVVAYLVSRWITPAPSSSERTTLVPAITTKAPTPSATSATVASATPALAANAPATPASAGAAAASATAAPASEPAPASAAAEEPKAPIELLVRGAPENAEVRLGETLLGKAPGPFSLPFGTTAVEVAVSAPGHTTTKLKLVPDRPHELNVELKRNARPGKRAPGAAKRDDISSDLENPF